MNFSVKKTEKTYKSIIDENGGEIATVWADHSDDVETIARMFAAAPELLDALEFTADLLEFRGGSALTARQAIAKAKGE